jgi:hypothetical protein
MFCTSLRRATLRAGLVAVYPLRQMAAEQRRDAESRQPRPSAMHVLPARRGRVFPLAPDVAVTQFGDRLPEHSGAA